MYNCVCREREGGFVRGVFLFNVCFAARVLFLLGVYFLLVLFASVQIFVLAVRECVLPCLLT